MSKTVYHDQLSVRATLRLQDKELTGFTENGKAIPPRQVRLMLNKADSDGKRYLPLGNCPDFDYAKGCPGHEVPTTLP